MLPFRRGWTFASVIDTVLGWYERLPDWLRRPIEAYVFTWGLPLLGGLVPVVLGIYESISLAHAYTLGVFAVAGWLVIREVISGKLMRLASLQAAQSAKPWYLPPLDYCGVRWIDIGDATPQFGIPYAVVDGPFCPSDDVTLQFARIVKNDGTVSNSSEVDDRQVTSQYNGRLWCQQCNVKYLLGDQRSVGDVRREAKGIFDSMRKHNPERYSSSSLG